MRREYRFAISAAAAAVLLIFAAVPPAAWTAAPSVCIFRNVLEAECFGCGMTRALASAMHGDLREALDYNSGISVLLPALIASVFLGLRR